MMSEHREGLVEWGWDEGWSEAWASLAAPPELEPARVVQEHRDRWEVRLAGDSRTGVTRPGASRAATGDWVAVREGGPDGAVLIEHILPRRTAFSRSAAGGETVEQVVAANVDAVWIVHGLDAPPNLRRLERYLTLAWESGARPVIVLNKADLDANAEDARATVEADVFGVTVRLASAIGEPGPGELEADLEPGHTIAMLGPSGAGKSSLLNALVGRDVAATGAVRESDRRGRHTTTRRELARLPGGALLLDTPGMRELRLWDVDEGLRETFVDIEELADSCRFRDCGHEAEPGCAVKQAVEDGRLDPGRFESYRKLRAEAEWQARRADPLARKEEVARVRSIMKSLKVHPKYRER
jgi:ribosome biogenesis GTPase